MRLSNESKLFLKRLASELAKIGANPVLLRNYDELPDEIGNDLDLYVSREKLAESESTLLACAREFGGTVAHVHRRDYFVAYWMKFGEEERFWHVDLYPGALSWHGYEYLETDRFLAMKRKVGDWNVPRKAHEALITLLTSLLWGGFFKERYSEHISKLLADREERDEFLFCLQSSFGERAEKCAEGALHLPIAIENPRQLARQLRSALRTGSQKKDCFKAWQAVMNHWRSEFICYFVKPPGITIAVPAGEFASQGEIEGLGLKAISKEYFGGILDLSDPAAIPLSKLPIFLRILKAKASNHLVIRRGRSLEIAGREVVGPHSLKSQIETFLSRRGGIDASSNAKK